eukprot:comp18201_c0_seq1/m.19078 comp18201_c0_seq1/g.19078  ORF comp18201_c0_seq1/g.19078 comp18201_c0_seq1/m.19078 type:complete len:195 (-) comp18201_c0_seq1:577-1161(-)
MKLTSALILLCASFSVAANPLLPAKESTENLPATHLTAANDDFESDIRAFTSIEENPSSITVSHIKKARKSVYACLYKLTDPDIFDALMQALSEGVEVKIVADFHKNHKKSGMVARLADKGADVRLYGTANSKDKLHAKFSIYDGTMATAGSNNWTKSSRGKNVELIIELYGQSTVDRFQTEFGKIWARSKPLH